MIPHPASALTMLSGRLMTQLLPDLKSEYCMSDGMLIGLLMNALADELGSGIDTRIQDVKEMQQLFRSAVSVLEAGELPANLESLIDAQPDNLTLDVINDLHDSLTQVLIELHELVDNDADSEACISLNKDIWAYLERQSQRHQITAVG